MSANREQAKSEILPIQELSPSPASARIWLEVFGIGVLLALTVFFLVSSWRKWPDPLVDFGRELYTPWRLANGAVLYRDVDGFYGPLSQYFNAALFAVFKPGLMVLVTANLVIFSTIVILLYLLFRQAWGVLAALTAVAIFTVLFGFSQFVVIGNYNYATPYSHEATHGFLVNLALTLVLLKWLESATLVRSFLAGLLLGLTVLLKLEIVFAGIAVTTAAVFIRWQYLGRVRADAIAVWAVGVVIPTIGFTIFFLRSGPFAEALSAVSRGWLGAIMTSRFTGDLIEKTFLGLDQPWEHLKQHSLATVAAALVIGGIGGMAWLTGRMGRRSLVIASLAAFAAAVTALACLINWREIGRCLLGLTLLYLLLVTAIPVLRGQTKEKSDNQAEAARQLIAILAAAMMARMILNGRIYQYGFYQAALAAMVIPSIMIGEIGRGFAFGRQAQIAMLVGSFALLAPGVVILARQSVEQLKTKTLPIGEGVDRFYAFPQQVEPTGQVVKSVCEIFRDARGARTMLAIPEGVMLNYLTRLPSTVAPFFFFTSATEGGREEEIVSQLDRRPPDAVVVFERDLRDYGIERYGERPGSGQLIVNWVAKNYEEAAHVGERASDHDEWRALILKHR